MATMRRASGREPLPLWVRNLSSTGLCPDSKHRIAMGEWLPFAIPAVGTIEGEIVWCEADRFGVAFAAKTDPAKAKRPLARPEANAGILPPVRDERRPGLYKAPRPLRDGRY